MDRDASPVHSDDDSDLPQMSLVLSADEDESKPSAPVNKRKRLLIADESSEDESAPDNPPDSDQEGDLPHDKRHQRVIDDDSDEGNDEHNQSKKVIRNLKSLCDEESSSDEEKEEPRRNLVGSSDEEEGSNAGTDDVDDDDKPSRRSVDSANESNDGELPTPGQRKEKNLKRKAKTEAENVISMIQRNAREDELTVPYHCPEQKSLKDFLASLQSTKSKLVVEEKVEIKTHKFKLLKNEPKGVVPDPVDSEGIEATEMEQEPNTEPEPVPGTSSETALGGGGPKLTLKGDPGSMIDLETGKSFVKTTVVDTLIGSLMRHSRGGLNNDPKFKPEPIPGAPMKKLMKNLENELERKRTEMIKKIMQVEKKEKDEEEELLDDEEFELDSDDDTKKRRIEKKKSTRKEEETPATQFNDDEEEVAGNVGDYGQDGDEEENAEEVGDKERSECGSEKENSDGEEEEEEEGESDLESDDGDQLDTSENVGKRPLRRIVAMDESDDEQRKEDVPEYPTSESATAPQPLFEDIPTEPLRGFEFSATQNDNELFNLCSGTFTTQLPIPEDSSQMVTVEASQVKDFAIPTATPLSECEPTQKEATAPETNGDDEGVTKDVPAFNLSSSEDEDKDTGTEMISKKKKFKRKKKRVLIEEDDEDEIPAAKEDYSDSEPEEYGDEEEEEEEDVETEEQPPIEELEEYNTFLSGKPAPKKGERVKANEFIEKEAELSDSEWGSEDEDERGLDRLEDIGLVNDEDNFDGEQLRDEVGRIHMRQMVNEDNRDLKYLKDLILNEEETDGQGRQRTFRWQNANNENDDFNASGVKVGDEDAAAGQGDDGQESDEEENEANWRKIRMEREKALLENTQNVTMQSKFDAVMRQTRCIKVVKPSAAGGDLVAKENSSPSFLMQDQAKKYMNLKQSFLLRDDETLSRLATISAKSDGASAVSDGKQNFVFRRIEEKVPTSESDVPKKRKSNGYPGGGSSGAGFPSNPLPKKRKV